MLYVGDARRRALSRCDQRHRAAVTVERVDARHQSDGISRLDGPGSMGGRGAQWRAPRLAWQRFARNPVGFDDVFSWILTILAAIFGVFASYKGYRVDDAYPGYGELDRELKRRQAIYEAAKCEYCRVVDHMFDRALQEQARLLSEVKSNIEYYQQLVSRSDDHCRTFVHDAGEIHDACNIVLKHYRQTNLRVRVSPAPPYFKESVRFDAHLVTPAPALSESEARLSRSYESAMKEFSEMARQNNATLQNL